MPLDASIKNLQRGDKLTISAELVDVRHNKLLWGEHYERKMSELLQTQREMAREIVEKLKLRVSSQERGLAKNCTESNGPLDVVPVVLVPD